MYHAVVGGNGMIKMVRFKQAYLTLNCYKFEDNNSFVFMVSNGERIRILAAYGLQYIKEEGTHELYDIDVVETYILREELEEIIEKLNEFEKMIR